MSALRFPFLAYFGEVALSARPEKTSSFWARFDAAVEEAAVAELQRLGTPDEVQILCKCRPVRPLGL